MVNILQLTKNEMIKNVLQTDRKHSWTDRIDKEIVEGPENLAKTHIRETIKEI